MCICSAPLYSGPVVQMIEHLTRSCIKFSYLELEILLVSLFIKTIHNNDIFFHYMQPPLTNPVCCTQQWCYVLLGRYYTIQDQGQRSVIYSDKIPIGCVVCSLQSQPLLQHSLELYECNSDPDSSEVATVMFELANLYSDLERYR